MHINDKNMFKMVALLNQYFLDSQFNNVANVEFPSEIKYKSLEWLYYIFYSCLLDYGMRSKIYHTNLINTYHKYKELFNPKYITTKFGQDSSRFQQLIKENIHPRYPNVATKKWLKLSETLSKMDNLLEKIQSFKTYKELEVFIKGIDEFDQKTGGLLLRLIYESNVCEFSDDISSIPLDRHDIEISYLNGIINTKNLSASHIEKLSKAYVRCSNILKISPDKLDKYLWEIGNKFCNRKDCIHCPLSSICSTKIPIKEKK